MFKILKDRHENSNADRASTNTDYSNMKYDFAEDEKLREMLNKIIHFEKMATAIPLALDGGLRQPKVAVCAILASWEMLRKYIENQG